MAEKWIKAIGRVSTELQGDFYNSLDGKNLNTHEILLFCTYSEFDIPAGHCFTKIKTSNDKVIRATVVLKNVTQQTFLPLEEIPHGWKTVCKFEFTEGDIPQEVQDLPALKGWTSSDKFIIFE